MENQQPQQVQTTVPAPTQTPVPAPAQPIQQAPQPSMISFNTTSPAPVTPELLARQANMIEDYQRAEASNSAYNSIIEQQQAQIQALIDQNNNLTQQVTQLVQSGAQFMQQPVMQPQPQPQQTFAPQQAVGAYPPVYDSSNMPFSLSADVDVSLESLASEIGKKPE